VVSTRSSPRISKPGPPRRARCARAGAPPECRWSSAAAAARGLNRRTGATGEAAANRPSAVGRRHRVGDGPQGDSRQAHRACSAACRGRLVLSTRCRTEGLAGLAPRRDWFYVGKARAAAHRPDVLKPHMIKHAPLAGGHVWRLKCGDPFVFGRGGRGGARARRGGHRRRGRARVSTAIRRRRRWGIPGHPGPSASPYTRPPPSRYTRAARRGPALRAHAGRLSGVRASARPDSPAAGWSRAAGGRLRRRPRRCEGAATDRAGVDRRAGRSWGAVEIQSGGRRRPPA